MSPPFGKYMNGAVPNCIDSFEVSVMGKRRYLLGAAAFAGMLVLILDGKTATQGAYDGVELCIKTVIPSLFPFFVLSNLISGVYAGTRIRVLRPFARICRIQEGMESILIPAFLGGYPVGAQTIAQGWRDGQLDRPEAERLLGFCNNAGPSFLFGMTAFMFPQKWMAWLLWGIHITAAMITANLIPGTSRESGMIPKKTISLPSALRSAITAMASVCGWVVFFRVMIAFLDRWILWLFPKELQTVIIGMMELSNGCLSLHMISDVGVRFIICSGMLAFGGLCVMMQVASVAQGVSLKWFLVGKMIQTAASVALAWVIVSGEYIVFGFLSLLIPLLFIKSRKNGSIPRKAGV